MDVAILSKAVALSFGRNMLASRLPKRCSSPCSRRGRRNCCLLNVKMDRPSKRGLFWMYQEQDNLAFVRNPEIGSSIIVECEG